MIICLSGFVIAGAAPAPAPAALMSRNDIVSSATYAPQHQQLLQQFSARGRCSSSSESVSSHSASPPPRAPLLPAPPAPRPLRVRTLYACLGESEGELSFEPNQIITDVTPSPEPGWLRGTLHGRSGLVPENYVEPLP